MNNYKFIMWDWDGGEYELIPKENIVDALYYAWNFECNVYTREGRELVFVPLEDNEFNSELLEEYGLRVVDGDKLRNFQNIKTGEVYKAPWE